MSNSISEAFEGGFLNVPLQTQIDHCDTYELAPLLLTLFKNAQPVLEAGCGSGHWNAWLAKNGIRSLGLDWSERLCRRAASELPWCWFTAGEMERLPLRSESLGGLMALGSIEHSAAGPMRALKEFHRVLRVGGIAIVTVPYGGWLRRTIMLLLNPVTVLKSNRWLRRILRKNGSGGRSLRDAQKGVVKSWFPRFAHDSSGYFFYEYEFNKRQMRQFLTKSGFNVLQEFVGFGDEGILHNFGRLAAAWNTEHEVVELSIVGKLLRQAMPVSIMGHMLCCVVTKE
jgi:ubiquinone/menaquinone biosynthesis C-methylase UbiE